jgi:hypothetical protein
MDDAGRPGAVCVSGSAALIGIHNGFMASV